MEGEICKLFIALSVIGFAAAVLLLRQVAWLGWRMVWRAARGLPPRLAESRAWRRSVPLRRRLKARVPRLYRFAAGRLATASFTGLPLSLTLAAALYLALLFGGMIEEVIEAKEVMRLDEAVNLLFTPWRVEPLLGAFVWITALGAGPALTAVSFVATGFLWADRRPAFILPLWISVLGSQATTWLGKFALARPRPEVLTLVTETSPSFPSGHMTGAVAVYGFLAYAILRDLPRPRERFEMVFWTAVLAGLIGFSRMILGVHYLSDIAGGLLVGGFWLLVAVAVAEATLERRGRPPEG